MAFGSEIKRLRKEAGLSVQALADKISVDADRMRKWEVNDSTPRYEDTVIIENFFGKTLEEIGKLKSIKSFLSTIIDNSNADEKNYLQKRRQEKNGHNEEKDGIAFVPISAQAGYSKNVSDEGFISNLEKIYIPGFPYRGDQYRYFEVAGDSMAPTFEEGFHVLAENIEKSEWSTQANYYTYVIVTIDQIMIKRIFRKDDHTWVIISDNEEFYPQFPLPVSKIKELWKVKRKIDWKMAPPKKFEIKI